MSTKELALPTSIRPETWNADTAAMMEFAGLTWFEGTGDNKTRVFAPAGIMAAFIQACDRTGLDPTTKQIYAALMGGKWTVLVGVDGMRVVAQRTGEYEGQTGVEWTADGKTWVDAWLPEMQGGAKGDKPMAARVGILRRGFSQPLMQVVTWAEFGMDPRFKGDNWGVRPAHMLGIRAETHALRKAFPNDLSGLYTPEDFTGDLDTSDAIVIEPSEDWQGLVTEAKSKDEIKAVVDRAKELGELTDTLRSFALARYGMLNRDEEPGEPTTDEAPAAESSEPVEEVADLDPADPRYVEPEATK